MLPIYGHNNSALCLTAAHNFEFIKSIRESNKIHSHPTLPPDFKVRGTQYLETEGCFAFYAVKGEGVACRIGRINYIENYDVAVFTVHSEEGSPAFANRSAIDLIVPEVGEEVAVLGHVLDQAHTGSATGIVERRLAFWFGVVTSVTLGPTRMGQSFSFETTIPVRSGMSGSPVLRKPQLGGTMIAIGVVSADFSEEASYFKEIQCKIYSSIRCVGASR